MKTLENVELKQYTTFRMGGTAERMYIPESVDELVGLCNENKGIMRYVLGGGSNLLINDAHSFAEVLCLREFNKVIDNRGEGEYYIGASVRLQELINTINKDGYGGIEYLYSVPGLTGGAVVMNAGRGKAHNKCISDYLVSVDVYQDGVLKSVSREDCRFSYRDSVFQHGECIVTGALFRFEPVSLSDSEARKKERIDLCKRVQDNSAPNFGTVFCQANKYIMELARRLKFKKGGVGYSGKTKNWLLNKNQGTYRDTVSLIRRVEKMHKLFRRPCKTEVKMWE